MKRNKIKKKYLNQPFQSKEDQTIETPNLLDQIENKTIKFLISLGLIFLMFTWSLIPIIIITLLGFHYETFNETGKIILLLITDFLFLSLLFLIYRKTILKDFKNYFNTNWKKHILQSITYWLSGLLIMFVSNAIIAIITNGTLASNEEAVRSIIDIAPWYMAFELIIYAPITEELIFRKSISDIFKNKYLYILSSGLIFGGLHVLPSLTTPIELLYLIPYCALGITFAMLYKKSNNIFSTITAHSIHNSLALILYLISGVIQ